jgi:hypothetical protein
VKRGEPVAGEVDKKRLQKMLAEGKSQREIAQALKIPRTRLQRILKSREASPATTPASVAPTLAIGPPVFDTGTLGPAELDAVKSDFWEMIQWWRDRKMKQVHKRVPRDLQRQTYHVERRYIELIRHEAESEGISITEVVNQALGAYFEKRNV